MAVFVLCLVVGLGVTKSDNARAAWSPGDRDQVAAAQLSARTGDVSLPQLQGAPNQALGWFLPVSSRLCIRMAGRRSRNAELELTNPARALPPRRGWPRIVSPRWLLPVVMSLVMLFANSGGGALAAPDASSADVDRTAITPLPPDDPAAPNAAKVQRVSRTTQRRQASSDGQGNDFPRQPFFAMPNVVVTDPAEYPRPECLENNDPNSFWYSMRPNIFNVPVEAEWDFYNIINTDRPDFTDAVYSVGKGVTILETGFTFTKINTFDQHVSTRQLPESLLRHGLTNEFELRLKWPGYLMTTVRDPHSGAQLNTFGSEDIDAGFKWEIAQQRGWRPMTTLVAGMTLPTGTPGTSANFVQPHFNLLAGWGIRRWLYVKWQTGCDFLHSSSTQIVTPLTGSSNPGFVAVRSPPNSWHESISILTQETKRIGAFHEWFMISPTGGGDTRAQHFLDMGLYLYATPNVQFDVRVGRQISNRVNEFFTGAGFSGRW